MSAFMIWTAEKINCFTFHLFQFVFQGWPMVLSKAFRKLSEWLRTFYLRLWRRLDPKRRVRHNPVFIIVVEKWPFFFLSQMLSWIDVEKRSRQSSDKGWKPGRYIPHQRQRTVCGYYKSVLKRLYNFFKSASNRTICTFDGDQRREDRKADRKTLPHPTNGQWQILHNNPIPLQHFARTCGQTYWSKNSKNPSVKWEKTPIINKQLEDKENSSWTVWWEYMYTIVESKKAFIYTTGYILHVRLQNASGWALSKWAAIMRITIWQKIRFL